MIIEAYNEDMGLQHPYDVMIPTDAKNAKFVGTVVEYIRKFLPEAEHIYIVASDRLFKTISKHVKDDRYTLIDENRMVEGLSFGEVRQYMVARGAKSINSVGWYFQQLLKFAFALTPYCRDYYLTWDSDTLPISQLKFFKDGKPLFTMKKEYHRPYFDTMQRLIGMDKTSPKSFIAEHMVFRREYVKELIAEIERGKAKGSNWAEKIINACDFTIKLPLFSEFETYGTFCTIRHPEAYGEQTLNTFRGAAIIRGRHINQFIYETLSRDVDIASFELNDEMFPYNWEYVVNKWGRWFKRLKTTPINEWWSVIKDKIK